MKMKTTTDRMFSPLKKKPTLSQHKLSGSIITRDTFSGCSAPRTRKNDVTVKDEKWLDNINCWQRQHYFKVRETVDTILTQLSAVCWPAVSDDTKSCFNVAFGCFWWQWTYNSSICNVPCKLDAFCWWNGQLSKMITGVLNVLGTDDGRNLDIKDDRLTEKKKRK